MDEIAGELREPRAAQHAQHGMHCAAAGTCGEGSTIEGQDAAEMERLIELVRTPHTGRRTQSIHAIITMYLTPVRPATVCTPF